MAARPFRVVTSALEDWGREDGVEPLLNDAKDSEVFSILSEPAECLPEAALVFPDYASRTAIAIFSRWRLCSSSSLLYSLAAV
jgi:hypothetical protein